MIRSRVPIILTSWGSFLALEYICAWIRITCSITIHFENLETSKKKKGILFLHVFLIFSYDLLSYKGETHFIFIWERTEKYKKCRRKYQFPKGNSLWDMFYDEFISFVPLSPSPHLECQILNWMRSSMWDAKNFIALYKCVQSNIHSFFWFVSMSMIVVCMERPASNISPRGKCSGGKGLSALTKTIISDKE